MESTFHQVLVSIYNMFLDVLDNVDGKKSV